MNITNVIRPAPKSKPRYLVSNVRSSNSHMATRKVPVKAVKMARPPMRGTGLACTLPIPGMSNHCRRNAIRRTASVRSKATTVAENRTSKSVIVVGCIIQARKGAEKAGR